MQVTIERLGHQGDGIASGPIYVARCLPGEFVEGEVEGDRIAAPRIVTPSPERVRPPCPHAKSCGGCALQHASDDFVARWKRDVVRTALAARGLDATPDGIETSPARARRRAVFSARRIKGGVLIGFHAPKSDAITRIPECQLLDPDLLGTVPALEALVAEGGSRKSTLRLIVTVSDGAPDVSVTGGKPHDAPLKMALAALAGRHGLGRLTWDGETIALIDPPVQRFGNARVVPPPGAFLQATKAGEAALLAGVRETLGGARKVADLFAGSGTFTLPLAEMAEVHAVEGDHQMLSALDAGWRRAERLKRVTTETRDLFRRPLLPDEINGFDAVVIDPPRAGAEAQFAALARSDVPRIAVVSCNPVTFARDGATLAKAGFRLDRLRVVDQFRWSTHVELVAGFSR